jgi:hypothetical protein
MPFKTTLARVLIGLVVFLNLQAALVFVWRPQDYAPAFELSGTPGEAAVRGIGVLFIMWNVPYLVALWDPVRNRLALYIALAMQAIGLLGESLIYLGLAPEYALLRSSIIRFIAFDAFGLLVLMAANLVVKRTNGSQDPISRI